MTGEERSRSAGASERACTLNLRRVYQVRNGSLTKWIRLGRGRKDSGDGERRRRRRRGGGVLCERER